MTADKIAARRDTMEMSGEVETAASEFRYAITFRDDEQASNRFQKLMRVCMEAGMAEKDRMRLAREMMDTVSAGHGFLDPPDKPWEIFKRTWVAISLVLNPPKKPN
jgi:hypothetical protein